MKTRSFSAIGIAVAVVFISCLASAAETLVDFNGIGPVGFAPPSIVAGGVTLSFANLEVTEVRETSNGFTGVLDGSSIFNDVIAADQAHFNGQSLTALGFPNAAARSPGFTRTIVFDTPVTGVSLYVADIDFLDGITANAYDEYGSVLRTLVFPAELQLDLRVQLVNFGDVSGVRKITLVGRDPVGIDNLSFSTDFDQLLLDLAGHVARLGLPQGIETSLQAKIAAAFEALNDADEENDVAAGNTLQAFINAVLAQSGKKIPEVHAEALIGEAEAIIDLLGA